MAKKFLSREEYLNQQRQAIIDKSLENSRNRILPTVPYIPRESKEQWYNRITGAINDFEGAIKNGKDKLDKQTLNMYIQSLNSLKKELNDGYGNATLCAGDSCIYTATDNYGKKYRVSGNQSFRANPAKYGFEEINLNDIKPGDIIQDFSIRDNTPHHAITFIGYDDNNKALFNYSKGGSTEEDIVKNGYYPFYWDDEIGKVHFDGKNNNKLQHSAAAYRFIGTEDDNKLWNENYNKERSNWSKQVVEELKQVPTIQLPNRVVSMKKYGGKQKQNKLQVKNGIAQPLGKGYYLMNGPSHEQGGIDIGKDLEVEGGEIVKLNPKSIKVLSNAKIMGDMTPAEYALGGLKDGTFEDRYNKGFKYQEKFKDINNLKDDGTKARFGKILNKLSNFYWHTLRAPKDYSEEVATLRNGCTTTECAKWSNDQLQKAGLSVFGDAWTRSSNKGVKKIYSGYDLSKRPKQYNKEEVIDYTLAAADSLAKTLDINQLQQNDIVGLYYRNSPNTEIAYNKGTNGETQTHTGHVVMDENGTPFVVHNVHGNIVKNKAEDLIGSKHPYGITSVYRKELGGQMKKKYKIGGNVNVPSTGKRIKADLGIEVLKPITITEKKKLLPTFDNKAYALNTPTIDTSEWGKPREPEFLKPVLINDNLTSPAVQQKPVDKLYSNSEIKNYLDDRIKRDKSERLIRNKDSILNAGDWINIGANAATAITDLIVGLTTPDIKAVKYADPISYQAFKNKTKVNITPKLQELRKTINKYNKSINENTISSKVNLNRLRDINLLNLDKINEIYGYKENRETELINKDIKNLQDIVNKNIKEINTIDQKNLENEIAAFNINRGGVGDTISGFIHQLAEGTSSNANAIERRKSDMYNKAMTYLANPNVKISDFKEGLKEILEELKKAKLGTNYKIRRYTK